MAREQKTNVIEYSALKYSRFVARRTTDDLKKNIYIRFPVKYIYLVFRNSILYTVSLYTHMSILTAADAI